MTRNVHCGPGTFELIVRSEWSRGNSGGSFVTQPPSETTAHFRYPIDIEAIRAEFDLPDCMTTKSWPNGSTALWCELTRVGIGGGPRPRSWLARRAARQWWQRWERSTKPRIIIGGPTAGSD